MRGLFHQVNRLRGEIEKLELRVDDLESMVVEDPTTTIATTPGREDECFIRKA
jgi:tetrahydromethanopterin S-methyltransferase subunit B